MLWMRPISDVAEQVGSPALTPELQFRELVAILRRRIGLILGLAVGGTVLAAVVGLMIAPKFTAIAQLVVEPQPGPLAERMPAAHLIEENVDTHLTLINSRDHLRRVAENLARRSGGGHASAVAIGPISTAGGDGNGPAAVDSTLLSPLDARATILGELKHRANIWISALRKNRAGPTPSLEELERGLRVNQERRSRVISVAFTSKSPQGAAALANNIVQSYVEGQSEQASEDANGEMRLLRERVADIKSEVEKAGQAVRNAIEQRLAGANAERNGQEPGAPLRELERDVASKAQLYSALLRREKELRDRQATTTPGVRVLTLATPPERPSSHNPILFIAPAMILALIGGGLIAVVLDRLDQSFRGAKDLAAIGIACIGLVPSIRRPEPYRCVLSEPLSPYAESIRAIVVALRLVTPPPSQKRVLITSSLPGEGKTTLATSLAVYLASIGQRVLLADLNLRHATALPGLERRIPAGAGAGGEQLGDELIQRSAGLRFDYLTMSGWPHDPLALFAGETVSEFLCRLRANYDCVIMDGPPLLGTAEAPLLPAIADESLLVVRWGSTQREAVQTALGLLDWVAGQGQRGALPAAVITQVDVRGRARFGSGDANWSLVKQKAFHALRGKFNVDGKGDSGKPAPRHAVARRPSPPNT